MKTLCITMGPEWPIAKAEFERVGLSVEPFQAIVEDNRVLAFNKSVYECMKLCRTYWFGSETRYNGDGEIISTERNDTVEYEDLLLLEDDCVFDCNNIILPSAPEGWMTIHLGCNIIGSDIIKWQMPTNGTPKGIAKLHNCWQTHANLYSAECVKYIIDNFKYVTDEYKTEGCVIFDEWLRTNVLNQGRSYVLNPMIAYQRPRFSEIWNCNSDYTGAHKQGNNWLRENL